MPASFAALTRRHCHIRSCWICWFHVMVRQCRSRSKPTARQQAGYPGQVCLLLQARALCPGSPASLPSRTHVFCLWGLTECCGFGVIHHRDWSSTHLPPVQETLTCRCCSASR